jgi:tetratricopeptide (TPR) repeat protein
MVGLAPQEIQKQINEATEAKRADLVVQLLRQMSKLDTGAEMLSRLAATALRDFCLDAQAGELRAYLAKTLPADDWAILALANSLHLNRHQDAGLFYERALEADLKDVDHLGNYALFLKEDRRDLNAAEAMYKRALEADPKDARTLGGYANFLATHRGDLDGAEALYKRALEADPKHANNLGNYSQVLFVAGKVDEAKVILRRAFDHRNARSDLKCELYFYAIAHAWQEYPEAWSSLFLLLQNGVRSKDWPLQENLRIAKEAGHPNADFLADLADVVSDKAPIEILSRHKAWADSYL